MDKNLYTKDSIESLSPREHVRLRPGMYAGDTSDATQLAIEILGNAIDEYNIGHGNKIIVNLNDNGTVNIEDYGQGFPINVLREDGETVLQASFDVINTSGKYRDDGVYEGTAIGLNGIGGKLVNFLSHWLEVVSFGKNGWEHLWFKEGIFTNREVKYVSVEHTGTTVTFLPSEEFFDNPRVNENKLRNFCEDITCLCSNLEIVFNRQSIKHDNGIIDLLKKNLTDIEIISNPLIIKEQRGKQKLDLALTYTGSSNSKLISYVNCGLTLNGPHITNIKSTLTRVLNKWAKDNKILKATDKNLDGTSLQEGLVIVSNITAENVAYDAQVKTTVTKIDVSFINDIFGKQLEIWLDNNPIDAKNIIEKALLARKAAEAAKKAREAVKNKVAVTVKKKAIQLPTTLTDCWSKDREKCELVICEGKSAASGLVAARDSEFQAVYGVRGKMLSVLKTSPSNIYKNQEINNLVQALGLPVNESNCKLTYQPDKLRYGKIIAAADADFDGAAIENLLFNIIWYMCPELIIYGHVYSAVPPLFRVTTTKNEYVYLKDGNALDEYKNKCNNIKSISRMKGLGECSSEELSDTLLSPNTRNIVQLKVKDYNQTKNLFEALYGKAVEPRVRFLQEHGEEGRADYE